MTVAMNNFFGTLTMNGKLKVTSIVCDNAKLPSVTSSSSCHDDSSTCSVRTASSSSSSTTMSSSSSTTSVSRWEAAATPDSSPIINKSRRRGHQPAVRAPAPSTTTRVVESSTRHHHPHDAVLCVPQRKPSLRNLFQNDGNVEQQQRVTPDKMRLRREQVGRVVNGSFKSLHSNNLRLPLPLEDGENITRRRPATTSAFTTTNAEIVLVQRFLDDAIDLLSSPSSSSSPSSFQQRQQTRTAV